MAILQGNAKQGSTRGFYPRVINGSLRFNDDDSAYLSWTPDSAGDLKTWTFSAWVKRAQSTGSYQRIFACGDSTDNYSLYYHDTGNYLVSNIRISGSNYTVATAALYRDNSAWYHIVVEVDCVNSIHKLYVNGQQITAYQSTPTNPPNSNTNVGNTVTHYLGRNSESASHYFEGYLADVYFIDGQALDADDFGETKNGVWVAKDYAGTFGTNGFHLTFEDDTEVEAFNTVLYNGNNGLQSITGYGFAPDLLWVKRRTGGTSDHQLYDTVRGASNSLESSTTDAEANVSTMASFESDGFKLNGANTGLNNSGSTYVAWGWKAGDSNVSNTDGSITSTVRANDTYGFSIVSYTGTGTASTIGHGLSSAPDFIILKDRDNVRNWGGYHSSFNGGTNPEQYNMSINSDGAIQGPNAAYWNNTPPTTSVFSLGTGTTPNASGANYIAYCWAEKTGYSKFGSYAGGTDGYSVTGLGFKPAWVLIKPSAGGTGGWRIYDNTRDVANPTTKVLIADNSNAESDSSNSIDIDADGFTLNGTSTAHNGSGYTYIYAAFADTREAAFWLDQSGNDNDWQPVNLDHNDTVADSPTDNFATLNPLSVPSSPSRTFSDGNLRFDATTNNAKALGTILLPTSGQWYWEATQLGGTTIATVGVADANYNNTSTGRIGYRNDALKIDETGTTSSYGATYQSGDTIGVAFDADADTLTFYKNGVSQGTAFTGMAARSDNGLVPFVQAYTTTPFAFNFGQQPFKYDPPE